MTGLNNILLGWSPENTSARRWVNEHNRATMTALLFELRSPSPNCGYIARLSREQMMMPGHRLCILDAGDGHPPRR
jgi:hypothetical protein